MGNPLTYRGYTFGWRGKQLVSSVNGTQTVSFEYNEDGLRQKKTVNGTETDYYYNGSVLIGMQRSGTRYLFSYDASGNVISVKYNNNEYYYVRNGQGDIVKLIDASGTAVVEYTYDTWGKKVTTTGSLAGTLGLIQPFRYRGYVYDYETGFYYLQSRYYDPTTGRFISADVLLSTGQGVLGHNAYAYCLGNPVNMADEGGARPAKGAIDPDRDDEERPYLYIDNQNKNKYTDYEFGWWGNLKDNGCLIYAIYNIACGKGYSFDSVYNTVMDMDPAFLGSGLLGGNPFKMDSFLEPYGKVTKINAYDDTSEYDAIIILISYTKNYYTGAIISCRAVSIPIIVGAHYYSGVAVGDGTFVFHNGSNYKYRRNSFLGELESLESDESLWYAWGFNFY